jgi:hypothetical protein
MQPITVKVGPIAPAVPAGLFSGGIFQVGYIPLNGSLTQNGIGVFDAPRKIQIQSPNNVASAIFTIEGTDFTGQPISETITGINANGKNSVLDYKTVTKLSSSQELRTATVIIGTTSSASTPWVRLDGWAYGNMAIQVSVKGNANYTLQQTLDDPNDPTNPVPPGDMVWLDSGDKNMVAATSSQQSNYIVPPLFARVVLNSGDGSLRATFNQAGNVGY